MRHIFYSSQPVNMTKAKFEHLVEHAVRKNHECGIHGAIAWEGGLITQILEGPADFVDDLYCTISADPRHTGVILLIRADITESQFHGFGMTKRNPFDLYLISLAITDRYGWGDTSAMVLKKRSSQRLQPRPVGLQAPQ